jgi:hypothetical protein
MMNASHHLHLKHTCSVPVHTAPKDYNIKKYTKHSIKDFWIAIKDQNQDINAS